VEIHQDTSKSSKRKDSKSAWN